MPKRVRAAVIAVLVCLSFVFAQGALAYTPAPGPLFNYPTGTKAQRWAIVNNVENTIASTRRGSTILIATYLMNRKESTDKLVAAYRRGVHVRIVFDDGDGETTGQIRRLVRVLGSNPHKPSFAVVCKSSCRGRGGNMHMKFYAFSRAGTAQNVVMVSSANLNSPGATNGWNDMYTMVGKSAMFGKYSAILQEMAFDKPVRDPYQVFAAGAVTSFFFPDPKATKSADPVYRALSKVRCHGATGGAGYSGRTSIHVAMFWWNGTRGMYLARRLLELNRLGCEVSVIYGAPSNQVQDLLKSSARRGGINLYDSRIRKDREGIVNLRVHSKYMTINGVYAGDTSSWHVFAGSQNWDGGALTQGDDNMLNISSRGALGRYVINWKRIRPQCRHIV